MTNPSQPTPQPSLNVLTQIINNLRLVWRLMLDSRVPLVTKFVPIATLVYVVSPVDFIPDVIPGLGQLDDLAVVLLGFSWFIQLCPSNVVEEHRRALRGGKDEEVVDGEYRVIDDKKK